MVQLLLSLTALEKLKCLKIPVQLALCGMSRHEASCYCLPASSPCVGVKHEPQRRRVEHGVGFRFAHRQPTLLKTGAGKPTTHRAREYFTHHNYRRNTAQTSRLHQENFAYTLWS